MDLDSSTIQIVIYTVFLSACLLAWFQFSGFLICKVFSIDDKSHSFIGVIFTSILGVYLAFLGPTSNVIYLVPTLISLLLLVRIRRFSSENLLDYFRSNSQEFGRTILRKNKNTYGTFLLFSIISLVVFIKELKDFPPGIISLGNADPINYGLVSRNMAEHGFETTNSFMNVDLARQAKFDWTGTMSFLASVYTIGRSFNINTGFYYLLVVTFLVSYFCVGLIQVSNRIYVVRGRTGKVFQLLLVTILISSQLNQYIVGNGFLAQILFTSMLPHGLLLIWDYRENYQNSKQRTQKKISHLMTGLALGTLILIYAPLGLLFFGIPLLLIAIVLLQNYKSFSSGFSKAGFTNFSSYFLGVAIGLLPLAGYLQVANSKLLVSGSASMPGWRLENFSLLNVFPGQTLCIPGEGICANTSFSLIDKGLIVLLGILIFKGLSSKSSLLQPISKTPALVFIAYLFILLMYFLSRYGISGYPTWKFLSFVQILSFLIFLPILQRGIDGFTYTEVKIKKKIMVQTRKVQISALISILAFYSTLNLVKTSELHGRSGFAYVTPKWITDLQRINTMSYANGLNIELDGYDGMLAAYYLPVELRAITKTSGYYSGIPRVFPLTLTNSVSIDNGSIIEQLSAMPSIIIVK